MRAPETANAVLTSLLLTLAVMLGSLPTQAQVCDDFDACTANDMCSGAECLGTPQDSGPCDDLDDCTINDQCLPGNNGCRGDPAPEGTSCANGCGSCLPIAGPGSPTICSANPGSGGMPCDPGVNPCLEGVCQILPGNTSFCLPHVKACPDTDGNPCTDNCNFQTGNCEPDAPKCIPQCESCDTSTGACGPANVGGACDDFDPCSPESRCEAIDLPDGTQRGSCMAGAVLTPGETPTPTPVPVGTDTPVGTPAGTTTATVAPGPCVGDCDGNHEVAVNELVIGVNIALGSAPVSECLSFDVDGSGMVEVNELISGVNSALNGCV
jgi:hypothetical protein